MVTKPAVNYMRTGDGRGHRRGLSSVLTPWKPDPTSGQGQAGCSYPRKWLGAAQRSPRANELVVHWVSGSSMSSNGHPIIEVPAIWTIIDTKWVSGARGGNLDNGANTTSNYSKRPLLEDRNILAGPAIG